MFTLTRLVGIVPAIAAIGVGIAATAVRGGAATMTVTLHPRDHGATVVSAVQRCRTAYGPSATFLPQSRVALG